MGDRGRLQTSQLQRMAPNHGDVRLSIESIPSLVVKDKAFTILGKIINNWYSWCSRFMAIWGTKSDICFSDRTLELELNLLNLQQPRLTWSGTTSTKLGLVEPGGSVQICVDVVPHETGLQVGSYAR